MTMPQCDLIFYPTASAMAEDRRPKFVRAEHLAMAKDENCAYGPNKCMSRYNFTPL